MVEQRPVTKEWSADVPIWGGANEMDIETAKNTALELAIIDLSKIGEVLKISSIRWEVPQAQPIDWWAKNPNDLSPVFTVPRVRLRVHVTFIPKPPDPVRKFNVW